LRANAERPVVRFESQPEIYESDLAYLELRSLPPVYQARRAGRRIPGRSNCQPTSQSAMSAVYHQTPGGQA